MKRVCVCVCVSHAHTCTRTHTHTGFLLSFVSRIHPSNGGTTLLCFEVSFILLCASEPPEVIGPFVRPNTAGPLLVFTPTVYSRSRHYEGKNKSQMFPECTIAKLTRIQWQKKPITSLNSWRISLTPNLRTCISLTPYFWSISSFFVSRSLIYWLSIC